MIDTDKYEGHSEDEWILVDDEYIVMNNKTGNVAKFDSRHVKISQPNMNLMLDAPLLLAEVKKLREEVSSVIRCMLAESEESPSWGATVHAYIKDLQKVIE
jgi:hypothetical protein